MRCIPLFLSRSTRFSAVSYKSFSNVKCSRHNPERSLDNFPSTLRPDLDFDFLLSEANLELVERNCRLRKVSGDIRQLHDIWANIQQFPPFGKKRVTNPEDLRALWNQLYTKACLLPNLSSSEAPIGDESCARLVEEFGVDRIEGDWIRTAERLVEKWGVLRFPRASCGERSYALFGTLVDIEYALLDYAFDFIYERLQREPGVSGVELLHVDDILPISTTRHCGVQQRSGQQHPLQYRVFHAQQLFDADNDEEKQLNKISQLDFNNDEGICLSGTAEMGIAEKIKGRVFGEKELPLYFIAESCCFRPEANSGPLEGGIYRVHEFKKIEMFVVCTERQSAHELERIVRIQRDLFASLQLHCRILDMPTEELGLPAARKFDIEAWMPGRKTWGEITSASNCTDYQSRRLHLRYRTNNDRPTLRYVHTCNGTGLALSRTLIALLETNQNQKGDISDIPLVIRQRMPSKRSPVLRCAKAASIKYSFD